MVEDTAVLDVLLVAQKRENVRPHYAVSIRKVPDEEANADMLSARH